MSAGSAQLDHLTGPGFNGSHYNQFAAGGEFIADTGFFPAVSGSAFLWSGNPNATALSPTETGFSGSYVAGTDGMQQVGGYSGFGRYPIGAHAVVWNGTPASAVDLNLSGASSSFAFGVKNGQQVGFTMLTGRNVETATLWNGSAASAVLLTSPTLLEDAEAIATDGVHQVGWVGTGGAGIAHAAVWTGTAASMVDLNPTGFSVSQAVTVAGGQEGGWAISSTGHGHAHPGIWSGSADSFVDLTPPAFAQNLINFDGSVLSTNGTQQVGYFAPGGGFSGPAIIWSGTADSAEFLPTGGAFDAVPYDIDVAGNIYGIAQDSSGSLMAIEWVPTPEPGSLALFGCGAAGLLLRGRKRS